MIKTHESQTINYQTIKILTRTEKIIITNVYWRSPISPTQDTATIETMINKENQLLVGDFNAHSQTWGNKRRDKAGQILEEKSIEMGFNIINTGEPTRIAETKKTITYSNRSNYNDKQLPVRSS